MDRQQLIPKGRFSSKGLAWMVSLLFALTPAWAQVSAPGQALPTGDGLVGDYYRGINFDRLVLSRRDTTIDFNWNFRAPGSGLPSEYFSVRWTGWLLAPASGRFLLHAQADDGLRVWVDEELVLDEWRPQVVSDFTATVTLTQGTAHRLRVEYFQETRHTRAFLNWSPPDESNTDRRANARQPIPTRYLFSTNPELLPASVASAVVPPAAPADTSRSAQVAQLAQGEDLVLPEVYFRQGQATLLPVAQAALNQLAAALQATPERRFEVQGHTDNVGAPELNQQLSQRRAEAVCRYLQARGVAPSQLTPRGYGSTQPVANNADPVQRPRNRRVVLHRL